MNLEEFRRNYSMGRLSRADLNACPVSQFEQWLQQIMGTSIKDPTAMIVGTCDASGQPNQRYVLLKSVSADGFVFFTDTDSTKGQEISANPKVSLLFPWHAYERQVRVQGVAKALDREKVAEYFHSRPRQSQVAAYTSEQSQVIDSRQTLEQAFMRNQDELEDQVPLPERWGGYLIEPHSFEFWQGGDYRLHDRFRYQYHEGGWQIERLQP